MVCGLCACVGVEQYVFPRACVFIFAFVPFCVEGCKGTGPLLSLLVSPQSEGGAFCVCLCI